MSTWTLALLIRPFAAFLVVLLITRPIRILIERHWPEGRIKRLLLRPLGREEFP